MQAGEIYLVFTEPLEELGMDYVVTGSVASSSYGEPRFTHDIDLVLSVPTEAVGNLTAAFPIDEFDCPPADSLQTEIERNEGGHFNLVHHESGFKADVYIAGNEELTAWAMANSRPIEIQPGRMLRLAPPEFVILGKLQFYTEGGGDRHVRDIRTMLELDEGAIDRSFIERWARKLGVEEAWRSIGGR